MPEGSLIFPVAEYRRRIDALQREMSKQDLDALLLTTPADVFYATGFLTRFWESPARPWFIVVPSSGDPVAVIPSIGADLMERCWISDIRTWDAPNPADDGINLLTDTLGSLVSAAGKIGIPMGLESHLRMPIADFIRLQNQIVPRKIVDGTAAVYRVREIKSEAEIEKIRATCAIADAAFQRVPEFASHGVQLSKVFRDFQIALLQEGADWVSYVAGGAGQDGYGDVISPADDRQLRKGDVLMLDTGAVREGYFCDFDRNYSIGPASDDVRRAHAALFAATEVALNSLRPDMPASDLYLIISDELKRQGVVSCGGRFGHGLGITLTEWPSVSHVDKTILREGMVLTFEPAVELGHKRILVHEENIVLRANGPELLSRRAPAEMVEILG